MLLIADFKIPKAGNQIFFNAIAVIIVFGALFCISFVSKSFAGDITSYARAEVPLSVRNLPYYALFTTIRILLAAIASIIFSLIVATAAAKNKKIEEVVIPMLDILQSVPILGYISLALPVFLSISPGTVLGVELAVIFVIFTSQVWNITFSLYQSLKSIPSDILDAASVLGLSPWKRFWSVEVPFAIPGIVWNVMLSVSGSWFYIVASESLSVGNITYTLPGIGSYLGTAILQRSISGVIYALFAMLLLLILYNKFVFEPLMVWADKFKYEELPKAIRQSSVVYDLFTKSYIGNIIIFFIRLPIKAFLKFNTVRKRYIRASLQKSNEDFNTAVFRYVWYFSLLLISAFFLERIISFLLEGVRLQDILHVFFLGFITFIRVMVLVLAATVIWVPVGVYIGLKPALMRALQPIVLFLASFPANLVFPVFIILIIHFDLSPNIWLSPLIMLSAQWYILLNVLAGVAAFPSDLLEAASVLNVKGMRLMRKIILPGIFPYLITGMLTASGAAWNASIVAEAVNWGEVKLYAVGIGAYITKNTSVGDYHNIVLGLCVMSVYVVVLNKLVWRPLYRITERKLHLG